MLDLEQARLRAAECGLPEEMAELSVFRVALHQPSLAVALYGMSRRCYLTVCSTPGYAN